MLEGKYRLKRELGAGGMGQVFLAEHETIERTVAIKVLHQDLTGDESVRKRFETEAKAIARLRHPNCVMLYEFGFSDDLGAMFAVFEYVEGSSLENWIGEQLPVADVLEVGRQVAAGMHHAHQQKVIHRDLKPENIMAVDSDGEPVLKILDFGIARIAEDSEKATRLTKAGQMFGTPPYMSPEQVRAKLDITHSTDIYAIGVILYELLEGRLPFLGDTPISTVMMHLNEEVPPLRRDDVPEQLEQIIMRCLEKEPDDRFDTCKSLEEALEAVSWSRSADTVLVSASRAQPADHEGDQHQRAAGADEEGGNSNTEKTRPADEMTPEEIGSAPTVAPGTGEQPVLDPEQDTEVDEEPSEQNGASQEESSVTTTEELQWDESAGTHRPLLAGAAVVAVVVVLALAGVIFVLAPDEQADDGLEDQGQPEEVAAADIADEVEQQADELAVEQQDSDEEDDSGTYQEDEASGQEDEDEEEGADEEQQRDEREDEPAPDEPAAEPSPAPAASPPPQPEQSDPEETEPDEPAEPGALELERRRRGGDQEDDQTEDDQQEVEQPAGIGLPERD